MAAVPPALFSVTSEVPPMERISMALAVPTPSVPTRVTWSLSSDPAARLSTLPPVITVVPALELFLTAPPSATAPEAVMEILSGLADETTCTLMGLSALTL